MQKQHKKKLTCCDLLCVVPGYARHLLLFVVSLVTYEPSHTQSSYEEESKQIALLLYYFYRYIYYIITRYNLLVFRYFYMHF